MEYDREVLQVFLKDQGRLFDEPVAETEEEAAIFLDELCAVVVNGLDELKECLDETMDISEVSDDELCELEEVFTVGDGRYLIVEG